MTPMRANRILNQMDRLNLYRIAAQRAPFAIPVKNAFRYTSGFGMRWGRMHNGTDFAAPHGTPIYRHRRWCCGSCRMAFGLWSTGQDPA